MSLEELNSLLVVLTIAVMSPFLSEWIPGIRLPLVVLELGWE
jgi:hypothetical protein